MMGMIASGFPKGKKTINPRRSIDLFKIAGIQSARALLYRTCSMIDTFEAIRIPALMGDLDYALLNAKRISQMVIDVIVSAELLLQAVSSEDKRKLASTFIHRHMLSVDMNARRISTGDASRIKRYDTILGL